MPNKQRYTVRSSDVIADMRVNVLEPNTNQVVWYKERFLAEDEIVEHVFENQSSTLCWSIHKPKRGWYIRLCAPSFPPGAFIALIPVPRGAPHYVDAALSFSCRTLSPSPPGISSSPSTTTLLGGASTLTVNVHAYPPTPPPQVNVQPPSPADVQQKLDSLPARQSSVPRPHISTFILSPNSSAPLPPSSSLFSRALSLIRNHQPTYSNSFTLSSLVDTPLQSADPTLSPTTSVRSPTTSILPIHAQNAPAPTPAPLLAFHDQTPFLTVGSFTGTIEIDRAQEGMLGVDTSFWVTVALTYLEFLEERESYLAAASD